MHKRHDFIVLTMELRLLCIKVRMRCSKLDTDLSSHDYLRFYLFLLHQNFWTLDER